MKLDPAVRAARADAVVGALQSAVSGSTAGLRGSLARGVGDPYSDIDVFWELPDAAFESSIDALPEIIGRVGPIESIRSDPLLQESERRRLVYLQFCDMSLYWRVDIEVFAESIGMDSSYDLDNRDARGDDWSLTHSALMNGVAAVKSLLRGDEDRARESIDRAFQRIDQPTPDGSPWSQVATLAAVVGRRDLEKAELVRRVQLLHRDALAEVEGRGE